MDDGATLMVDTSVLVVASTVMFCAPELVDYTAFVTDAVIVASFASVNEIAPVTVHPQ